MRGRADIIVQAGFVAAILLIIAMLGETARTNLATQHITGGFGFLSEQTGWDVASSFVEHTSSDPYWWTFVVGLLNTLALASLCVVLAGILGCGFGFLAASPNPLVSLSCRGYVNIFRNIPQILQVFFWYAVTRQLPPVRRAISLHDIAFLSNRGLNLPSVGITGPSPWVPHIRVEIPHLAGFNFRGGVLLSPEFVALVTAIVLYNVAFIAEIIRSGISAVPRGQIEAAQSLGLRRPVIFRKIILAQALRIVIPPLTGQAISLAKSTSLAIAIGYTEFFQIATIAINNTGHAIEIIALLMVGYLLISYGLSAAGAAAGTVFRWPDSR